jgi:hypothetical protein
LMHIWLPSGFRSQSSMLRWYRPHCAMRSKAFWRSCCVVYGFHARVAISWQPVHYLNRISGGSCGLYTAKNVRLFWRIVFGVGFPYVVASWSNISWSDIIVFHPVVGRVVGGATLNASFTCALSVL